MPRFISESDQGAVILLLGCDEGIAHVVDRLRLEVEPPEILIGILAVRIHERKILIVLRQRSDFETRNILHRSGSTEGAHCFARNGPCESGIERKRETGIGTSRIGRNPSAATRKHEYEG